MCIVAAMVVEAQTVRNLSLVISARALSLRGAKRRSNPSIRYAAGWIASMRSQ
jgi:hypothetical protein